jgi:hypothetical protein
MNKKFRNDMFNVFGKEPQSFSIRNATYVDSD